LYAASDRTYENHYVDAGIDYSRVLSFSRRTTVQFGTGTSASRSAINNSLQYSATGSAKLNHEIARTWRASVSYSRGLQFYQTWPEPVFSDSVIAGVSGLPNSRMQVSVTARAIRGGTWEGSNGDITNYSGVAGVSFAATRYVNTSLTYGYYRHDLAPDIPRPPGFPSHYDGQTIRASVSVWAPLFQSERRP
jgi:hypothetical protein